MTPNRNSASTMTGQNIHDKTGEPIKEGDHVYTKIRGGRHEGDVEKIVTSNSEAEKEGVKNPPKVCSALPWHSSFAFRLVIIETDRYFQVLFTDQKGKDVAHNPETLEVKEQPKEYESSKSVGA